MKSRSSPRRNSRSIRRCRYETGKVDFVSVFSGFMNVVDFERMDHEAIMQFTWRWRG